MNFRFKWKVEQAKNSEGDNIRLPKAYHYFEPVNWPENVKILRVKAHWFRNSDKNYYATVVVTENQVYPIRMTTDLSGPHDSGVALYITCEYEGVEFEASVSNHKDVMTRNYFGRWLTWEVVYSIGEKKNISQRIV